MVSLATRLRAQTDTAQAPVQADSVAHPTNRSDSADVLLLDVDLAVGSLEPTWVFLQKGQVYRVELTRNDVDLAFRTPARSIMAPFFSALEGNSRPSTGIAFEVYPRADAMYEIRITGGPYGAPTTMKLYRDISRSKARQEVIASRKWDIGMEVAFGTHSAYPIAQASFSEPAPVGEAGVDIDLCFSVRGVAASLARFGGCVVGVGYQSRPSAESSIVWIFSEPRFRVVGGGSGRSGFEAGLITRIGIGMVNTVNVDPISVGPGVYVSRQIRRDRGGWSLIATYARVWISGTEGAQSNRFAIGLGRF